MSTTTHGQKQRGLLPYRTTLTVLCLLYTIGLGGMAFLLASKDRRADWQRRWTVWLHSRGTVTLRTRPLQRPTQTTSAARSTPRRVLRSSSTTRSRRLARRPARRTSRVRIARRSAPKATRSQMALRPPRSRQPLRVARRTSEPLRQLRIICAPRPSTVITWAHPPDPTLPPECRPRNPVVVSQF